LTSIVLKQNFVEEIFFYKFLNFKTMKKNILSLAFTIISVVSFGQSVLIEPATSTKRFIVKSTGGTYGHFSTSSGSGADLFFKNLATGDGFSGTDIGTISTFNDRIYLGGSINNQLSLGANGQERMRFALDGKVGIGTFSPNYNLHLHNPATGTSSILQLTNETIGSTTTDGLYIGVNNFGNASIINQEGGSIGISSGGGGITVNDANVGIGNPFVSATTGKLEVFHNTSNVATTPHINLRTLNNASNGMIRMENSTATRYFGQYFNLNSATAASNFVSFDYNGTTPVLTLYGNGDARVSNFMFVDGFTKLGSDSPEIKMKKLTGTTAATQGSGVNIPHGITDLKILSLRVMINYSGNATVPDGFNKDSGFECNAYVDGIGNIRVENKAANSVNILSKPFTILVTYEY
jgi:hypothetical protein